MHGGCNPRIRPLLLTQLSSERTATRNEKVWPAAIVQAAVGRNPCSGCGDKPTPRGTVAPRAVSQMSLYATPPVSPRTEHGWTSNNLHYNHYNRMVRSYRSSRCGAKSMECLWRYVKSPCEGLPADSGKVPCPLLVSLTSEGADKVIHADCEKRTKLGDSSGGRRRPSTNLKPGA